MREQQAEGAAGVASEMEQTRESMRQHRSTEAAGLGKELERMREQQATGIAGMAKELGQVWEQQVGGALAAGPCHRTHTRGVPVRCAPGGKGA